LIDRLNFHDPYNLVYRDPNWPGRDFCRTTAGGMALVVAAKYIDCDRPCLCPHCGFAGTEDTDRLSEDEQWAKLGAIVDLAETVWGTL
jgi:hypothetical protein